LGYGLTSLLTRSSIRFVRVHIQIETNARLKEEFNRKKREEEEAELARVSFATSIVIVVF
jgi:hypothetical protein